MKERINRLRGLAKRVGETFPEFHLAGGSAVMFRHRYRESIDLDFFYEKEFSFRRVSTKARSFFDVESETEGIDNIDLWIEGVKVSFVFFPFSRIDPIEKWEGIRMASDYDIFLNKIYAAGRPIEPKDPVDAAFLYNRHGWAKAEIKRDFERKFPDQSYEIFLGALLSFDDYPGISSETMEILMVLGGVVQRTFILEHGIGARMLLSETSQSPMTGSVGFALRYRFMWSVDTPVCAMPITPPQVGEPTLHAKPISRSYFCRQDAFAPGLENLRCISFCPFLLPFSFCILPSSSPFSSVAILSFCGILENSGKDSDLR
ncbi:MAG: hypothetical protein D6679_13160 [Candidatus Hydrogenedentota bacterium]|nr:MAG: hypothetical protein D6679_13160 [Candidatus Hydrogenedentota bacterium]